MSDNSTQIFDLRNILSEGREKTIEILSSQVITLQPRTLYIITTSSTDVIVTINAASLATKGAYSTFVLNKGGTGNAILQSGSLIGSASTQTINVDKKAIIIQDNETSFAIKADTRTSLSDIFIVENIISTSPALITINTEAVSEVDASAFEANISLPDIAAGDKPWYWVTLKANGNHCNLSTPSSQLIGAFPIISISTVNAGVIVQGNGVDGYDIIADYRPRYRPIPFSTDLDLTSGFESMGSYEGSPPDGTTITVTIKDWAAEHRGDMAFFTKISGVNSSIRVVTQNLTDFDQSLTENDTQFEIKGGYTKYLKGQDNRPNPIAATINYYPVDVVSVLEPGYKKLVTSQGDPNYPPVTTTFEPPEVTGIDSANPQSLGFFIDDIGAISGLLSERNITAVAQVALTLAGSNRSVKFRFNYYSYDITTTTLEAKITETGYSEGIVSDVHTTKLVSGVLSSFDWTGKTLVIELLAFKSATGGTATTLSFQSGGDTPSKTTIDVPATSMTHDSLGNVFLAGLGIAKGHISNVYQKIAGNKEHYNQLHGGNFEAPFATSKTFDADDGNFQQMEVTGDTTIGIFNELPGTFYIALPINSVANPNIAIGASFGKAINYTPALINNDGDRNVIQLFVYPDGSKEYTIYTTDA